jgi:CRP/FNR family cyclic AMP-dependent transcriptional regulator
MQHHAIHHGLTCPPPAGMGIDLPARLRLLGGSRLFGSLSLTDQMALAVAMDERLVARGADIFRQGEAATLLFAVMAGQVRIVLGSADGRGHVLRCVGQGEFFGESAVREAACHTADAVAVTKCRLLLLDRRRLMPLLETRPVVAMNLIALLCDRLHVASNHMEGLLFRSLEARLAHVLIERVAGRRWVDITQAELGDLTGATRESVNKKLRAWQAAGWVALQPGRVVVLDLAGLRAIT